MGTATLALLARHERGRALLANTELLLLDALELDPRLQPLIAELGARARWLPAQSLRSGAALAELIAAHGVDEVIEVAHVGTWDCLRACAEGGASYLTTCYDLWPPDKRDPSVGAMARARELFAPPDIHGGAHLLSMGMNPGLINAMVGAAIRELAQRSGRPPSLDALELHAIVMTEKDSTRWIPGGSPDAANTLDAPDPSREFACTWSPDAALEELLEPRATYTAAGELAFLDHPPHRARYRARCGHEHAEGYVVPHEELVTLGAMYPTVELAYVYEMCPSARAALDAAPERAADDWEQRRLYPPYADALDGDNRLGVLLCSRSLGELWLGWDTPTAAGLAFGTNAVQLQVAAGVLAGWTVQRELEPGVWLPEEVDGEALLGVARDVLGPFEIVWDRDAPARSLTERRLP
ncbi:Homospermidine synthase-like protein [Plesiocystis pacifica SIR-1]|uniref:Homospermidine synthase-like protein n=1 Tax=Plesiocystis pacifica SIR-1 TaxID=391625 RepID=A6GEP1_9BACT|nr:Homospermidine synthase-like protein [Plesiocystis pacifica SIR-1]